MSDTGRLKRFSWTGVYDWLAQHPRVVVCPGLYSYRDCGYLEESPYQHRSATLHVSSAPVVDWSALGIDHHIISYSTWSACAGGFGKIPGFRS